MGNNTSPVMIPMHRKKFDNSKTAAFAENANAVAAWTTADADALLVDKGIMALITSEQTAFVGIPIMRVVTPELPDPQNGDGNQPYHKIYNKSFVHGYCNHLAASGLP